MKWYFSITLLLWLMLALRSIFVKKRLFDINMFVLIGIYLPMGLFFLNWSLYVDTDISDKFYLIFSYLNLFLIIYNILVRDCCVFDVSVLPSVVSEPFVLLANVAYVLLFEIESYLGSGSFAPALMGIDIHTYSAPIISFVTRSLYAFVIMNFLAYLVTRKKDF